mmetsp:Transcript_18005/g.56478  ORF Transcript_18005/g.56478 Transcript_18005/m.56478 type:complete len:201 (+) Transcript_18005:997-1599(+)
MGAPEPNRAGASVFCAPVQRARLPGAGHESTAPAVEDRLVARRVRVWSLPPRRRAQDQAPPCERLDRDGRRRAVRRAQVDRRHALDLRLGHELSDERHRLRLLRPRAPPAGRYHPQRTLHGVRRLRRSPRPPHALRQGRSRPRCLALRGLELRQDKNHLLDTGLGHRRLPRHRQDRQSTRTQAPVENSQRHSQGILRPAA